MRIPTTQEFDEVFGVCADEKESAALWADCRKLMSAAMTSDSVKAAAAAMMPTLLESITLGGLKPKPALSVLMVGFQLGCLYSEKHVRGADASVIDNYLAGLDAQLPEGEK